MTFSQSIIAKLWWGPLRRPFEALTRRTLKNRTRVLAGPLHGAHFKGGLAHTLGIYEIGVQQVLEQYLKPGATFYDIGAHKGYFSLLGALIVGKNGHVFAFEPLPSNQEDIRHALKKNGVEHATLVASAVSNKVGTAELIVPVGGDTSVPTLLDGRSGEHGVVSVPTLALDDFVAENPPPDFIKMDVEGAEDWVLQGADRLLRSDNAPALLMEVHSGENSAFCEPFLRERGYNVEILHTPRQRQREFPRHIIARKMK